MLRGLPHALLLQDEYGAMQLLLPATAKPINVGKRDAADESDEEEAALALRRGDPEWLRNLGSVRHHLCAVHPSECFVAAPTLAAALHLLVMRFLHCQ